jgi:TetR/AcrR family transcriptional regulator, transcriptional repressor for nem operon
MGDSNTRGQIVEAADRLFYRQGYEHTSFSDIADAVRISRGNFYYYFKTKDEILDAVIAARLAATQLMLRGWEKAPEPEARLRSFIRLLLANRMDIGRYGCPVGTLCSELAKLDHAARDGANELFGLFRAWLRREFERLDRGKDADALALHLLALSQGIAVLANAWGDEAFIRRQVQLAEAWLDEQCRVSGTQGR